MTYQLPSFHENTKVLSPSSVSAQGLPTSYTDVPESNIDYKPTPSASFVIYMFSFYFGRSSTSVNRTNLFAKLQYSDDNGANWSDWGDNTECYAGSVGSFIRARTTIDIKFALDTSGWTSTKRLRLVMKRYDSSTSTRLHQLESFHDENGEVTGTFHYTPSVSCYSVE